MKTNLFFALSVLSLLAISCNNSERDYVGTEKKVLDSIYNKNKKILIDLCDEIQSFDDIQKTLDTKIIIADSLMNSEDFLFEMLPQLMTDSTYLDKEFKFDPSTAILVSNHYGLSVLGFRNDTSSTSKKYKFDLNFFDKYDQHSSIDFISVWDAHNGDETDMHLFDSITIDQKKERINSLNEEFNQIKKSKYIVYAYDLRYLRPKIFLKEKKFDSAILVTKVIVFDRLKKSKIGEKILIVTNSKEIGTTLSVMASEEDNVRVKIKEVENNLGFVKIEKMINYLKREKDSTDL
jgi:hypothetical protein